MISSVVTAIIFFLLSSFFPHRPKQVKDYDKLILVNEYKYKIYELLSIVFLFFFIGVICYFFYLLGSDVSELYFRDRKADFAIYPPDSFWLLPGLCFGFGLFNPPIELLYRMMLRDEYGAFEEYTSRKYGMDGGKVGRLLCSTCVVAGLVCSFLGFGWYKEINGDNIIINDFTSLEPQEYTVQEIVSITHYENSLNPKGEIEVEPHYKIIFFDGRVWDTSDNFHEVSEEKYNTIVSYVAARTKLKVKHETTDTTAD